MTTRVMTLPKQTEMTFSQALRVCDDGKGFAIPTHFTALTQAGHFGLMGMRERAILVEGAFAVVSAPDKGTQVALTV